MPAALGGAIDAEVADRVQAQVMVKAANGPTTPGGQAVLERRNLVVVPDILANAGGVTASYFEWVQARHGYRWDDDVAAERLRQRMDAAFTAEWTRAESLGVGLRPAAFVVAVERLTEAIEAAAGSRSSLVRRSNGCSDGRGQLTNGDA